jgi:DNA-binding Xre family transcriptional regulator
MCGISPNTWTKINRNEEVSMTILNKICAGLGVTYADIIEYIPTEQTCLNAEEAQ